MARQLERERQDRERAAQEARERPQSVPAALRGTMGDQVDQEKTPAQERVQRWKAKQSSRGRDGPGLG